MKVIFCFLAFIVSLASAADDFPLVPGDVEVVLFAKEPLVRNPCGIAFDEKGRLCVGMGPQYRKPKPDTPGDSVWILLDQDGDGVADGRKEFASGFNAIQSLAWRGFLWLYRFDISHKVFSNLHSVGGSSFAEVVCYNPQVYSFIL